MLAASKVKATCSSSSSIRSFTPRAPTVCAVIQLPGVKVRVCVSRKPPRILPTSASVGLALVMVTVTSAAGSLASARVKVSWASSGDNVTALCDSTNPAASTSVVRALARAAASTA